MKLVKNGSQNEFVKTDFKDMRGGKDFRSPVAKMPPPNTHNTHCKSGPLQPTHPKVR